MPTLSAHRNEEASPFLCLFLHLHIHLPPPPHYFPLFLLRISSSLLVYLHHHHLLNSPSFWNLSSSIPSSLPFIESLTMLSSRYLTQVYFPLTLHSPCTTGFVTCVIGCRADYFFLCHLILIKFTDPFSSFFLPSLSLDLITHSEGPKLSQCRLARHKGYVPASEAPVGNAVDMRGTRS